MGTEENTEVEKEFDPLNIGDDDELFQDKAFQSLIESKEEEQEPEADESESIDKENGESTTSEEKQEDTQEEEKPDDEFVFDKEQYEKQGIKDENALKLLESKDRDAWNKDKVIGRQGKKMGDMKKDMESRSQSLQKEIETLKSKPKLTKDELNEKFLEDPTEAQRLINEQEKTDQLIRDKESKHQSIQNALSIENFIPEYSSLVKDIAEIIKEDTKDIAPGAADSFIKDPYDIDPATAVNLARVAVERRKNTELLKQVESLKKQLEQAPRDTLSKLKNVGKNTTTPVNSSSTPDKKKNLYGLPVELMSDTDLADDN